MMTFINNGELLNVDDLDVRTVAVYWVGDNWTENREKALNYAIDVHTVNVGEYDKDYKYATDDDEMLLNRYCSPEEAKVYFL